MARGSIRQRSKGSWTIILSLGRDSVSGKLKQKWLTIRGTKKQAEEKLTELLRQLDTGSFIEPSKRTVADLLKEFLAHCEAKVAAGTLRARTLQGYSAIAEQYLTPQLGAIPLQKLTVSHVKAYHTWALTAGSKKGGGVSRQTLLHHHRLLSEALSFGEDHDPPYVGKNVARKVKPPTVEEKGVKALDVGDVRKFLGAAEGREPYRTIYLLDIHTGLRRSEILGLTWADIDLLTMELHVRRGLHQLRGSKTVYFEPPKSKESRRTIALTPESTLVLQEHRERQEAAFTAHEKVVTADTLVFANVLGVTPRPDTLTQTFAKIAKDAGLKGVNLHGLRHTHASLMLKAGVPMKVVQTRLGHATLAVTSDIYSHVFPDAQKDAATRFGDVLRLSPVPAD